MAAGLQCWDAAGSPVLDTNYRVTRVLGSMTVTADGSLTVSPTPGAKVFAYLVAGREVRFTSLVPTVTVTGNVISWLLNGSGAGAYPGYAGYANTLVWGEY